MICLASVLGMVACQQQQQQQQQTQVVETVPAVKPVQVKPRPVVKPRPLVKPIQVKPVVKPEPSETIAETATSHSEPEQEAVKQPVRLKPLAKRVSHVPMKGKYVALTFDDGPHASLTPRALDILNRHGAKGTFFMLGSNALRNQSVVARAAAEGHELGVHTWTHIKMNSSSRAKVDREVSRTQNLLGKISGTYPRVMRPPYGATNQTLVNHMYNRYGMASVLWDVDTLDWRKPGVSKVVSTAVSKARPGSIILVHDIHASTLNALEDIVTGLQARGFKLVTVSELLLQARKEAEMPAPPAEPETPVQEISESSDTEAQPQPVEVPTQLVQPTAQQEADMHAASDVAPTLQPVNFILP